MENITNDYYWIAYNDLLFLGDIIDSPRYNNVIQNIQQIVEKSLKSVLEHECSSDAKIDKLLCSHNLRAIYDTIHAENPDFLLNRDKLSTMKDYYYDSRYPGDNFVTVTKEECEQALDMLYDTLDEVNKYRSLHKLEVFTFTRQQLGAGKVKNPDEGYAEG